MSDNIKLQKIIFWPIIVLVMSFIIIVLITSQVHRIQNQKNLHHAISAGIYSQEGFFSNESVLGEDSAIFMRLKTIADNLQSSYYGSAICMSVSTKPIYLPAKSPITYCSNNKFKNNFIIGTGEMRGTNAIKLIVSGEEVAEIKYASFIAPTIITSLPPDLLTAILIAALITFIVFYFLIKRFKKNIIDPFQKAIEEKAGILAASEVARQVAHDIKGPLATMNFLFKCLTPLPEEERLLIRSAIQRISDIANGLLSKHDSCLTFDNLQPQPELISELLKRLIAEKRVQYLNSGVTVNLEISNDSHCMFSNIIPTTFKRAVSNLIDNAVEASIEKKGIVTVTQNQDEKNCLISVSDNGCGIDEQMIPKIFVGGVTNKEHGHGMGLNTAKKIIELCDGNLGIKSCKNCGTTVHITLPKCTRASWFIDTITLHDNSLIYILDDDENIHHLLDEYFLLQPDIKENSIIIKHFYNSQDFIQALADCRQGNFLFLIDHELIGSKDNGLDLVEKMDIAKNSILITNQYDYDDIRKRAKALQVKIIPKDYISYIVLKVIK